MIIGMNYYMLASGLWHACMIFKRRTSVVFILVVSGLISTIIEATASYIWLYMSLTEHQQIVAGIITCIFWQLMLQIPCWLYVIRIKTLNCFNMSLVNYVNFCPYILFAAQIPSIITFMMAVFNNQVWGDFVISSAVTTVCASMIEIFLYCVLLFQIKFIFAHKRTLKKQMELELTASMLLLIVLDISLLVLKLGTVKIGPLVLPTSTVQLDNAIRPFSYLLRIKLIIQFFDELLDNMDDKRTNTLSYYRWAPSSSADLQV